MFKIVFCMMSCVKAFMEISISYNHIASIAFMVIFISYDHDAHEQIQFLFIILMCSTPNWNITLFSSFIPFISCLESIHLFNKFVIWIFCTTFHGIVSYYHVAWLNLSLGLYSYNSLCTFQILFIVIVLILVNIKQIIVWWI
jgi:hypothetical protein